MADLSYLKRYIFPFEFGIFLKLCQRQPMKKNNLSILLFSICYALFAQGSGPFVKNFQQASGSSKFNALLPLTDGGFLLAGTCPDSAGTTDALILRTDASGNSIWSKKYGKKGFNEEILAAKVHPSSGFALSGFLERRVGPNQNIREDMLLLLLDANGEIQLAKSIGDDNDDERASALKVDAGGFFLIGKTMSDSAAYMAPCVFRLDGSGNYISHNLVEDQDDDDYLLSWAPTSDGGFIGCGSTRSYGVGNGHIYLIRYNAQGDVLWTKTHAAPGKKSLAASIIPVSQGAFMIAGYAEVSNGQPGSSFDLLAMKINEDGDSIWSRCYGNAGEERATSISATSDGGFVLAGFAKDNGGSSDVMLVRINANGDTLWTRKHGSSGNDAANAVSVLQDGSIVWAGQWDNNGAVLYKCNADGTGCFSTNASAGIFTTGFQREIFNNPVLHLVNPHSRNDTLDLAGTAGFENLCINSVGELVQPAEELLVYPNPATNQFHIKSREIIQSVQLTDPAGKTCLFFRGSCNAFLLTENNPGIFFLKINTASGAHVKKIMIQK